MVLLSGVCVRKAPLPRVPAVISQMQLRKQGLLNQPFCRPRVPSGCSSARPGWRAVHGLAGRARSCRRLPHTPASRAGMLTTARCSPSHCGTACDLHFCFVGESGCQNCALLKSLGLQSISRVSWMAIKVHSVNINVGIMRKTSLHFTPPTLELSD